MRTIKGIGAAIESGACSGIRPDVVKTLLFRYEYAVEVVASLHSLITTSKVGGPWEKRSEENRRDILVHSLEIIIKAYEDISGEKILEEK